MKNGQRSLPIVSACFMLGAGFSRAISSYMPLVTDLAESIRQGLGSDHEDQAPFGDDVEGWLTHLATSQPWLSEDANLRNRAAFLAASRQVGRAVTSAEDAAMGSLPEEWLMKLVWEWAAREDNVVTLNYDTLVERAAQQLSIVSTPNDLYAVPVVERWGAGESRFLSTSAPTGSVLRLFKLHGSTNWFHAGVDSPIASEPVVLPRYRISAWQAAPVEPEGRERYLYSDLMPLIVPPSGTKSTYFASRVMRAQWRAAADALRHATRIVMIGYSIPTADLQVRQFLSTCVAPGTPVTVVNPDAQSAQEVQALLPQSQVDLIDGDNAVSDFAATYTGSVFRAWLGSDGQRRLSVDDQRQPEIAAESELPHPDRAQNWMEQEFAARWSHLECRLVPWDRMSVTKRDLHLGYVPRGFSRQDRD